MSETMLPRSLAVVDDDADFRHYLTEHLEAQGLAVAAFDSVEALLAEPQPGRYGFYVVDLSLPGQDGLQLIRALRQLTEAGVLVVSGRLGVDVFAQVLDAGADMYLAKPVGLEQVLLTVRAVHRRSRATLSEQAPWVLHRASAELQAPDGTVIALSELDQRLLACLAEAGGEAVARERLLVELGRPAEPGEPDPLNSAVFRLRRRIERATTLPMPLQSKSRVGYAFRARLLVR
jgi:DNA-binding response OmpR family regulator